MSLTSYEPLFLKYRPQSLDELVGQESIKETLKNAINNNKLVNAYLFTGPRGTGKTSSARIFAKSLNCLGESESNHEPTIDPCGKCSSCVGIINSTSLDVVEIDAASHGNVEDARSLIDKVNLASVAGNFKIYIIDEVHMLSNAAFNALLKVFEEPPEKVVFILATTEEDKVLPTIVSRCQKFSFRPISLADQVKRLKYVADKEEIKIEDPALELIAKRSDGGMRDALSLLDQLSVFKDLITLDKVLELVGGLSTEDLNAFVGGIAKKDAALLISTLDKVFGKGKEANQVTKELSNFMLELLEKGEHHFENSELVQMIDILSELELRLKQSSQSKSLVKAALLKLAYREDIAITKDLLKRLEILESGAPSQRPAQSAPARPSPEARPKFTSPSQAPVKESQVKEVTADASPQSPAAPALDTNADAGFLEYLSPACKGIYLSSKANLAKLEGNAALIEIPARFKFLKSKLETKSEEILSAIKKAHGDNISELNIVEVEKETESSPYADKPKVKAPEPPKFEAKAPEPVAKVVESLSPKLDAVTENFDASVEPERNPQEGSFKNSGSHKLDETVKMAMNTFAGKVMDD